ncbi:MAG TPA: peptidoglycan-binding domain-containing protein [Gemmatimonadaceae bacterium]|nr:peptidoglycan-binding domain-containing protein [Gemmatimonadaceae bacterium]
MQKAQLETLRRGAARAIALSLFAATAVSAQTSLTLPEGSVIIVRTATNLESANAQVGQSFGTFVVDTVRLDDYTVIPSGSRIRGTITFAQAATRSQSGVIEVNFDRLILPDGTTYPITGKLTSTNAAERRQIDADPNNNRVVLVGGRGGIGAGIAGAGGSSSNILTALGGLLSEGRNVSVPAGTRLAVQLEQPLSLRARGSRRAADQFTVYTAEDRIRAAQQALAAQNYYRGSITGQYDDATQQAIFNYQIDKGLTATGNLDWRTARSLGIVTTGGNVGGGNVGGGFGGSRYGAVLSLSSANSLRRNADAVLSRVRSELSLSTAGTLSANRAYTTGDIDLWFALSAFANNAMLYENLVRTNGNNDASAMAGRALINAARLVDTAMQSARASTYTQNAWNAVKRQLGAIDSSYSSAY